MKTINKPLRVVLDTNVLLVSILPHHKYYWVFKKFRQQYYNLLISNEILTEYQEKLEEKYGILVTDFSLDTLQLAKNAERIEPYYRWLLIKNDPDDDKFVDTAVAGNADFIVTEDKHFNILKTIDFPKVEIVSIEEFRKILEELEINQLK